MRGNIYILKGAVTGTYTNLAEASKTQKKYTPENRLKKAKEASAEYTVYGNDLYYNEKRVFYSIYYLGD